MAFAHELAEAGFTPERVQTAASVKLEKVGDGFKITTISLEMRATVPDIDESTFQQYAEKAKNTCPVSQALAGVTITLQAALQT